MDTSDIIRFVSDGFEKAKRGDALEVYKAVAELQDQNRLPLKSHYPFGWIIYYALHQSPAHAIRPRKRLLARYLGLSVTKPHKLHSMILTEAIRLYKDASELASLPQKLRQHNSSETNEGFSIVRFVELWDLTYLRPGDCRRKEHEGRQLPSTVEKLITHYADELYSTQTCASEQFMTLALKTLAENPTSDNLYAQCSRLYELAGEKEKAVEMLRNAILASSSKFYLWTRLADIISHDGNHRLTVSLLYKALKAPGQEDFKARTHLKLAMVLANANSPTHAMWELGIVKRIYDGNGWNLPRLYKETLARIPHQTIPADPTPIYRKLEYVADDFIYETLPEICVTKTYHKKADPSKGSLGNRVAWRVTDSNRNNYWFQPAQFKLPEDLPLGTSLAIKTFNGKVVKCKLSV